MKRFLDELKALESETDNENLHRAADAILVDVVKEIADVTESEVLYKIIEKYKELKTRFWYA